MKPEDTLTPSQFEILRMVAGDMRYAEIAKTLGLSRYTVVQHIHDGKVSSGKKTAPGITAWFARSYRTKEEEREGFTKCCEAMAERRRKTRRAHKVRLGVI